MKAVISVINESRRIKLDFPVSKEIAEKLRHITGADWSWSQKTWHFPCTARSALYLKKYVQGIEFEESISQIINDERKDFFGQHSGSRRIVRVSKTSINGEKFLVICPDNHEDLFLALDELEDAILHTEKGGWIIRNERGNLRRIFSIFKGKAWVNADAVFEDGDLSNILKGSPGKPSKVLLPELSPENQQRLDRFINWIKSTRYSPSTLRTYTESLRTFFRYLNNKIPEQITEQDLIDFNNNYILKHGLSASFQNQVINAIKLYFRRMENHSLEIDVIQRPRRENKLPNVLSKQEVQKILQAASANIKHMAMLSLIYSCGLRRNELLNLKLKDVDSNRGLLIIRNAKGKKDRVSPLSTKIVELLREYYQVHHPMVYLFEGWINGEKYSERSIEEVLKKYVKLASVNKPVTLHWLRHSYATHLLESGTDLRYIQEILGHKSSKTTEIYTHVSTRHIQQIKSPFDDLNFNE